MIIGVTGLIGSGKSTTAALLAERLAARVVDADSIGHAVLARSGLARFLLRPVFGSLERTVIARQAFASRWKLALLNAILHPLMRRRIRRIIKECRVPLILDAALLFPLRLAGYCDRIIVVLAERPLLHKRLAARGYTAGQIKQRLAANTSLSRRRDGLIYLENNGTLDQLKNAVLELPLG